MRGKGVRKRGGGNSLATTILLYTLVTLRASTRIRLQPFRGPCIVAGVTQPQRNSLANRWSMVVIYSASEAENVFLLGGAVYDRDAGREGGGRDVFA